MRLTYKTRWKVGLSNGENFIEGNAPFEVVPGELSPWLKLQEYLKKNNLVVTSLSLIYKDRTFNLPSAGSNPKFSNFDIAQKPIGFNFGRPIGLNNNKLSDLYARIEAIYPNYKLQLWVDESNPNNSWVLVI